MTITATGPPTLPRSPVSASGMLTTGSSTVWIGGQNGFGSDGVIGVVALGVAALGRPDAHLEISEVGVLP